MPVIDDSIEIDRPRNEVFEFLREPANTVLTNANVLEYEQLDDGTRGKGIRDRGVVKVAGKRIDFVQEITEFEPAERIAWRSTEAPMSMEWTLEFRLEDAGEGRTRLRFHQNAPSLGGFFGKLTDGLVVKMYTKDVRANLENTKALLEEG